MFLSNIVLFPESKMPSHMEIVCRVTTVDGLGASVMLTVARVELDVTATIGTRLSLRRDGAEFEAEILGLRPVWGEGYE